GQELPAAHRHAAGSSRRSRKAGDRSDLAAGSGDGGLLADLQPADDGAPGALDAEASTQDERSRQDAQPAPGQVVATLAIESAPGLIKEKIAEYGARTREHLYEYLPDQEPRAYLYDLVAAYPERSSSMLRPSLLIASAKAFGARIEEALNTAAAVELMHNAMLVHDDIEDISELRRNAP